MINDYLGFVNDAFQATGFNSRAVSEDEMALCMRSGTDAAKALRKSYCKRLRAFRQFQEPDARARADKTIAHLLEGA